MGNVERAFSELRRGGIVLIHDNAGRENETDLMVAAEFVSPEHISIFRRDGGGLICVAVNKDLAAGISLPFMVDVLNSAKEDYPLLRHTTADDIQYDAKSSFSVTVNHRDTFTGITDGDRALTVKRLGEFFRDGLSSEGFGRWFRSPGHVHLLISSGLKSREGHTELTTSLLEMSGLTPVSCICEMMDSETHKALSAEKAKKYADMHNLVFLEAKEIKDFYRKWEMRIDNAP